MTVWLLAMSISLGAWLYEYEQSARATSASDDDRSSEATGGELLPGGMPGTD